MVENDAYAIDPRRDGSAEVRRIARGRLRRALHELTETTLSDPGTGIHEARKELKRLRSLLRLSRAALGEELYRETNDRWRQAGRRLGPAREADVRLETLATLAGSAPGLAGPALAPWWSELTRRREAALEEAMALRVPAVTEALARDLEAVEGWELGGGGFDRFGAGLQRAQRRGRRFLAAARTAPTGEHVHELRKRVKDHWYMLELLTPCWPPVLEPAAEAAHRLSSLLGDDHDLVELRAAAATAPRLLGEEASHAIEAAVASRRAWILDDALPLAARLYGEGPRALRSRLSAYWEAASAGP